MQKLSVGHGIIENRMVCWRLNNLALNVFPGQFGSGLSSIQIVIQGIVAEPLVMPGKIRQRLINLAHQKVLAIIRTGDDLGLGSHILKLARFLPVRQSLGIA